MSGWIKLHRSIVDHPLWLSEPFTWGQAWTDILLNANYAPGSFYVRKQEVKLERGQLAWSELTMADRWKWSRGKVRRFLAELEKQGMITQHKTRLTSVVTITNYSDFQDGEDSKQKSHRNESIACIEPDSDASAPASDGEQPQASNKESKPGKAAIPKCPHQEIISAYNEILPELRAVIPSRWEGSARARDLAARWREDERCRSVQFWRRFFTRLRDYPFYMGENDRGWQADLGWIVKRKNFDNLLERFIEDARRR